jgi:hypothetical protein
VLPGSDLAISAVDLATGGGTAGTQHVLVQGNVDAFTNQIGLCPCDLRIFLLSETGEVSEVATTIIGAIPSPDDNFFRGSASWSHLFTAHSGTNTTYFLVAQITPTLTPLAPSQSEVAWSLQATQVPFNHTGANPTLPVTTTALPFGKAPFKTRSGAASGSE